MTLLITGLILFAVVHLTPALFPGVKTACYAKLGEGGYKGIFSLLLLAGMAGIIMGWRSTLPELVYLPSPDLRLPALALVCLGFFLFTISNRPSRVRQFIRHPQLTGLICWSVAHLLLNGEDRSLLVFGALGIWAIVEIIAINRREGAWVKGEVPELTTELVSVLITAVVIAVVVAIHPWISGMPVV
ncbi:MAG: NnrU family protein [Halioglobus sp.]